MSNREAEMDDSRVVWVDDEKVFGTIVGSLGAYYTIIRYIKGGIEHEVLMENDEFTLLEDFFEHDSDD